ncbi:MAG: protein kinase [Gemmatimonadota bacterium]
MAGRGAEEASADLRAALERALTDRYTVERSIGVGGMATVYLAQDIRHRRAVAIKLLHAEYTGSLGAGRFMREIEIAARLSHPHILPLLDSGTFSLPDGRAVPYYVMPFVAGETLEARLERDQTLPLDEAIRIVAQVSGALDYAHRSGIIHRDVKPANILIHEGHALVADFGVAHALNYGGAERITKAGISLGTPQYMSPEQITGDQKVDARTDIYALGCVFFEMVSGAPPFMSESVRTVLSRRLAEPPPSLIGAGVSVPEAVDAATQRALATMPADRFDSAGEFSAALAGIEASPRRPGARRWIAIGATAILAASVTMLALRQPAVRRPSITSLAIQPLTDLSQDTTTLYLSQGIHEAVADLLRRVPQLTVTAPSLVADILRHEPTLDLQALARRLDVGAVLTWQLRRSGASLHLHTELVDAGNGAMLWSATYERNALDALPVQHEIARTIADSLRLRLSGADREGLSRQATADPIAYDYFMRGRRHWILSIPPGATGAREHADSVLYYAEQALARDSLFAGAHALLADFYVVASARNWITPFGEYNDRAIREAQRAIALDSTQADAWIQVGVQAMYLHDDTLAARAGLERAVRLGPLLAVAFHYHGIYLGEFEGRLDSAVAQLRRAVALEPTTLYYNTLGDLYMRARKYDSAEIALRTAIEIDPMASGPRARLIRTLERLGRFSEAIEVRRGGPNWLETRAFETALKKGGPTAYQRVLADGLQRRIDSLIQVASDPQHAETEHLPPSLETRIAALYAERREWSKAMDWVLRDYQRRPKRIVLYVRNPDFEGLRSDPRFVELLREKGLGLRQ